MSYLFGAMHISRSFVVLRSTLGEGVGSAEVIVIGVDFPIINSHLHMYNLTLLFLIRVEGGGGGRGGLYCFKVIILGTSLVINL